MSTNSAVLLESRPSPNMVAENFRIGTVAEPTGPVPAGSVLAELVAVSVDPYMRGRMNDTKGYFVGPFEIGKPLSGGVILRILESGGEGGSLKVGDMVQGFASYQMRQVLPVAGLKKVPSSASSGFPEHYYLGVLGLTGLSAYIPLLEIGKPVAGETLFVSGAAGAVGSVVGQVGKILGLKVYGAAGSDDKVRWLVEDLKFDGAFNYKTTTTQAFLASSVPGGVDIYFDNVGGETLDQTLGHMKLNGRIIGCGSISQYDTPERDRYGVKNLFYIVTKRLKFEGFIISDLLSKYPDAVTQLATWVKEGSLKSRETIYNGLEKVPEAFLGLFVGANTGKAVILV